MAASSLTVFSGVLVAQQQPAIPPGPPAEQTYRNIQVLKGTPAEQLLAAMQFITSSLGVHCDHCHDEKAFEKDDKKPKQTARQMMRMMFDINGRNFNGDRKVTCYSCHAGRLHPTTTPALAGEVREPVKESLAGEQTPQQASASIADVLDRYLRAVGGSQALGKLTSLTEKGTVTMAGGIRVPIEVYRQNPGRRSMILHVPTGDVAEVFDGAKGWIAAPYRPVREMNESEREAAAMDADLAFAKNVTAFFSQLTPQPDELISGRTVNEIAGSRPGLPPIKLYFDRESGALVRTLRYVESPLGLNPTQIDYSDFREVEGVRIPFQWRVSKPEGQFTVQIEQAQINLPMAGERFARPSSPPAR